VSGRTGSSRGRALLLAAVTLLSICPSGCIDAGGNRGDADVRRSRIGDTLLVHNTTPLVADTIEPVEVHRYGRVAGPPEAILAEVQVVAVGPEGDVYTFEDRQGIRRFPVDGTVAATVAPYGRGPREVRWLTGMAVGGDGRVAAYDLGNGRITVLHPDSSVSTHRMPVGYPRRGHDTIVYRDDGTLWVGLHPPTPEDDPTTPFPRPIFLRLDADGSYGDTIFAPERLGERCPTLSHGAYRGGFWEDKREPWIAKAEWAAGPDGSLAFGCPDRYTFDVIRDDGVLRVSREWTAVTASAEERAFYEGWHPMPTLPETRPAYARIVLPGDGRIWVWPVQPNRPREIPPDLAARSGVQDGWEISDSGAFDVFERDGRWLGQVALPDGVRYSGYPTRPSMAIRGDTLWAVTRDELDVEYVVRYEVRWPEIG